MTPGGAPGLRSLLNPRSSPWQQVAGHRDVAVAIKDTLSVAGDLTVQVGRNSSLTVTANQTLTVEKNLTIKANKQLRIIAGDSLTTGIRQLLPVSCQPMLSRLSRSNALIRQAGSPALSIHMVGVAIPAPSS